MRKLLTLLLIMLVAGVGSVAQVAPASAVGSVTVSAGDLRLAPGQECGDIPVQISVPADVPSWNIDLTVYAPDGSYADGAYYFSGADPNVATNYFNLCTYNGVGMYSVVADVEVRDAAYNSLGNYRVTDTFSLTKQPKLNSNMRVRVTESGAHGWKITGRLTRAGDPWALKRSEIQVHYLGAWRKLYAKRTDRRGVLLWMTTPKPGAGKYLLRLYAAGTATTKPSASRTFRLPAR